MNLELDDYLTTAALDFARSLDLSSNQEEEAQIPGRTGIRPEDGLFRGLS